MDEKQAKEILDNLYKNVDGRSLSLVKPNSPEFVSKSFTYGEVLFDSFIQILKEADPKEGSVFLDCGSGIGKAVFIAHLLYNFSVAAGIELLDSLYQASQLALDRYEKDIRPQLGSEFNKKKIKFVHGDMLDIDFTPIDLVFVPSTCFQEDLMRGLIEPMNDMRPGTKAFSVSKILCNPNFDLYKEKVFDFSWGKGTVYYHIRV